MVFKREHTPWNKGLTSKTDKRIASGLKHTPKSKELIKLSKLGSKNPQYGKTLSKETREKMSLAHKGKIVSSETKLKLSKSLTGRKLSKEHCKKISKIKKENPIRYWKGKKLTKESIKKKIQTIKENKTFSGENNPAWKGGISPHNHLLRTSTKFKEWRKQVFERDDFTCQNKNCGFCNNKIGANGLLHSHHVIPFAECLFLGWEEEIFDVDNGITHCKDFHNSLHKGVVI